MNNEEIKESKTDRNYFIFWGIACFILFILFIGFLFLLENYKIQSYQNMLNDFIIKLQELK